MLLWSVFDRSWMQGKDDGWQMLQFSFYLQRGNNQFLYHSQSVNQSVNQWINRSFPSSLVPLSQKESKCKNDLCVLFHLHADQSSFHKNGFVLRLALKERHKGTRKFPFRIACDLYDSEVHNKRKIVLSLECNELFKIWTSIFFTYKIGFSFWINQKN